ncbi:MAG: hypothetical protein HY303_08010 [Candidatus Wallbacteria bacterium]|nr:hypothetical protein [Candidatus Wallbacteria bacterium]
MKPAGTQYRFDLRVGKERFYVGIYNAPRLKVLLNALRPGTGLVLTRDGNAVAMEFASPASAFQWLDRQTAEIAQNQAA